MEYIFQSLVKVSKRFASFDEKTADEATTLATKDRNINTRRLATNSESKYHHFDFNKAGIYNGARTRRQQTTGRLTTRHQQQAIKGLLEGCFSGISTEQRGRTIAQTDI